MLLSPPLPPGQRTQGESVGTPASHSMGLPQRPPSWCVSWPCARCRSRAGACQCGSVPRLPCPYLGRRAAGTQLCSLPRQHQCLVGITKHQRGPRDLPEVSQGVCSRAKVQAPTQPAPGKHRATLVPAKRHQPSQCVGERGDAGLGL